MSAMTVIPMFAAHAGKRRRARMRTAVLLFLASAVMPSAGHAEIYQWLDENGGVIVSDRMPVDSGKVTNLRVIGRSVTAANRESAAAAQAEARERALERRVAELEARLREQEARSLDQSASIPPGYADTAPAYTDPAPTLQTGPVIYASAPRPVTYLYVPPAISGYVVTSLPRMPPPRPMVTRRVHPPAPALTPARPRFTPPAPHFTAPAPQFVGRNPQFTGRTPEFVGRTPQFLPPSPPRLHAPPAPQRPQHAPGYPRARMPR